MFIIKNKYFLIIKNINDINLNILKKHNKFIIIYRSDKINDKINDIIQFRKKCRLKKIKFYIANNLKLCVLTKSDGVYLSSYNRSFKPLNIKKSNFDIIGSAHNFREINLKIKQGCNYILLSKLFLVQYDKTAPYLGLVKYSKHINEFCKDLIPLGGININNLLKLKNLNCKGFAVMSEVKKKPAIIDRLF
tara:strand:+ start:660 stop:1232 length:573 start_codon:yes stop_codon:yes gene_type:complete